MMAGQSAEWWVSQSVVWSVVVLETYSVDVLEMMMDAEKAA